jgi:hypothetical protein
VQSIDLQAYYLPTEADLLRWVVEHPEYSLPQCISLGATGA